MNGFEIIEPNYILELIQNFKWSEEKYQIKLDDLIKKGVNILKFNTEYLLLLTNHFYFLTFSLKNEILNDKQFKKQNDHVFKNLFASTKLFKEWYKTFEKEQNGQYVLKKGCFSADLEEAHANGVQIFKEKGFYSFDKFIIVFKKYVIILS